MKTYARKALHDLRTMGARVTEAEKPPRRYIRLAILELEKVRRGKEKDRACRRIQDIDQRLREIAEEQASLTDLVGEARPASAVPPPIQQDGFTLNY
jgi:hypothetical protein